MAGKLEHELPHDPQAEDRDGLVDLQLGAADAVQGDIAERGETGSVIGGASRHRIDRRRGRDIHDGVAGVAGSGGDAIADGEARHPGADGDDPADRHVADVRAQRALRKTVGLRPEAEEIRFAARADLGVRVADEHLAGLRRGNRKGLEFHARRGRRRDKHQAVGGAHGGVGRGRREKRIQPSSCIRL